VGIVGATGAVGREMLRQLELREFPVSDLRLFATPRSNGQELSFKGEKVSVRGIDVGPAASDEETGELLDRGRTGSHGDPGAAIEGRFAGLDLVLLSAGGSVSKLLSPAAAKAGAVAIDNSSAFRMDHHVPLVVPEVNPGALEGHRGIVANPNCSTIQMVVALKPIMDAVGLNRVVVATYQSASGAGQKGSDELEKAARGKLIAMVPPGFPAGRETLGMRRSGSPAPNGFTKPDSEQPPDSGFETQSRKGHGALSANGGASDPSPRRASGLNGLSDKAQSDAKGSPSASAPEPAVFPRDIGFNLFPLIDRMEDGCHCREEIKMVRESRKILNEPDLAVSVTTVRVPVFVGHALAMWIETRDGLGREECLEVLRSAPGLVVLDEMSGEATPTPNDVADDDRVWIGRVREDPCGERCLMLWVVANNLRKGAATNAVQIAEELASRGLLEGRSRRE
jgi:aspartate-semialdehyde dehydrogenase